MHSDEPCSQQIDWWTLCAYLQPKCCPLTNSRINGYRLYAVVSFVSSIPAHCSTGSHYTGLHAICNRFILFSSLVSANTRFPFPFDVVFLSNCIRVTGGLALAVTRWSRSTQLVYTVSQKTVQNCFCQNFVTFPPILIIFGTKMAKRLKLCELHSFSTSPNSHHHTAVLNADVPNCQATQR